MSFVRLIFISVGLVLIWQAIILLTGVPHYILPGPLRVAEAAFTHAGSLFDHAMTTLFEIIAGLLLGTLLGASSALSPRLAQNLLKQHLELCIKIEPTRDDKQDEGRLRMGKLIAFVAVLAVVGFIAAILILRQQKVRIKE